MSKQVIVVAKCDWPDCGVTDTTDAPLTEVDVWFYQIGPGRKRFPTVRVDLCPPHLEGTQDILGHFMKVGDSENAHIPGDTERTR